MLCVTYWNKWNTVETELSPQKTTELPTTCQGCIETNDLWLIKRFIQYIAEHNWKLDAFRQVICLASTFLQAGKYQNDGKCHPKQNLQTTSKYYQFSFNHLPKSVSGPLSFHCWKMSSVKSHQYYMKALQVSSLTDDLTNQYHWNTGCSQLNQQLSHYPCTSKLQISAQYTRSVADLNRLHLCPVFKAMTYLTIKITIRFWASSW